MIDTNHVVLGQVFRKTIVLQPIVEVGYITTRPDKDKYKYKEKDGQTTDSRQPLCFIKDISAPGSPKSKINPSVFYSD